MSIPTLFADLPPQQINIPALNWPEWCVASPVIIDKCTSEMEQLFSAPILILDVESNDSNGQIIGIGLAIPTVDGTTRPNIIPYYFCHEAIPYVVQALRCSTQTFIGHNLGFDLDILGISRTRIYWDTYLGSATEDPTKPTHALKDLCERELHLSWPTYKDMTVRGTTYKPVHGKPKTNLVRFDLGKIQKQHPKEVANYNAMDLVGSYWLSLKQRQSLRGHRSVIYQTVELPISILCKQMQDKGIRVDRAGLEEYRVGMTDKVGELESKLLQDAKIENFNLRSPKQVLTFLKSRGHDIKNTGVESLQPFVKKDPWIETLLEYRGQFKLLSTYIEPLLEHSAKDGRIHTRFNQIARKADGREQPIITGRFSSSDPVNLQNQPPEIRKYFIPEDNHVFVCADYSQIDLRSLAHLSKEPVYCDAFRRGDKVHQVIADKFKVEYKLGKIISLALAYNGGPGRLMQEAQTWGYELDFWQCKKLSDEFITKLAALTRWKKEQYAKAKRLGGVWTLFGRWIPLPYPTKEDIEENPYVTKHWENSVIAFQGQGGTADIVKVGMLRLASHNLIPNAQVHDELLIEVPEQQAEETAQIMKRELEGVTKLCVPLVAEVKWGRTWMEAKP